MCIEEEGGVPWWAWPFVDLAKFTKRESLGLYAKGRERESLTYAKRNERRLEL